MGQKWFPHANKLKSGISTAGSSLSYPNSVANKPTIGGLSCLSH